MKKGGSIMIVEGVVINKNHDLVEIGVFPLRATSYAFIPDTIADRIQLGQRLLFKCSGNDSNLEVLKGF